MAIRENLWSCMCTTLVFKWPPGLVIDRAAMSATLSEIIFFFKDYASLGVKQ